MITLGILQADQLYSDLIEDYQSYGHMFAKFFADLAELDSSLPKLNIKYYAIQDQQYPADLDECDAYLLTGSKTGVYDDADWLPALDAWLKKAYDAHKKLIGICFGHQMLANSLGGKAEKSNKGWGVGVRQVNMLTYPLWLPDCPSDFQLIYSHQDQVTELPTEAKCLAGDDFCPNAAFYIENQVLSFQGHPEFNPEYTRRLLGRRAEVIGQPRFDQAMLSLDEKTDEEMIGVWLLTFLQA